MEVLDLENLELYGMLKILPIMLFSNSQYICLLFPRKYPLFPTILSDIQWNRVILPPAGLFHLVKSSVYSYLELYCSILLL